MVVGEDRSCQVIEPLLTAVTEVSLTVRLSIIAAVLDHRVGRAMRTSDTIGPAHLTDGLKAFGVVDEIANIDHRSVP